MKHNRLYHLLWLFLILLVAGGLKIWLVTGGWVPFNADEAVVALMARHILQGEFPIFFYGQAYMGSLDAFLVAGAFSLFGEQVWAIRLVQGLLYLAVLLTTAWLGRKAFGAWKVGMVAMALLAVPTVNVTLYTTASLGGYGEALLIGNLILLFALRIAELFQLQRYPPVWLWAALGFFFGFGLWTFGLTLIYTLPACFYLAWEIVNNQRSQKFSIWIKPLLGRLGILLLAVLVGATPWWLYAARHGMDNLLWELGGGAIAGVEGLPWIAQVGSHLANLVLLGSTVTFGLRPPWDVTWLALPLLPFILMFWLVVCWGIVRCLSRKANHSHRSSYALLAGVILTLMAAFIFTPFGADPSGRYFVPLAIPLALFAAHFILELQGKIGRWAWGLLALVLIYNLWGTVQCALQFPPGLTTQFYAPSRVDHRYDEQLIAFLQYQGETRGYTNYWVSYPLAFLSKEELIFIPRLPYHLDFRYTARDDRYPPYKTMVAHSERVAYIVTHHPALEVRLRETFSLFGVSWLEKQIGDYVVFYNLSQTVRPEQIGLGDE